MAKRQQQRLRRRPTTERQLVLSFWTTCSMVAVMLLARLGSGGCGGSVGVDALSIPLNGNGNRLQQQQQLSGSNEALQTQHQLQHVQDNNNEGEEEEPSNYVMHKSTTELVPNSDEIFEEDAQQMDLNNNGLGDNLPRNQFNFGHPFHSLNLIKRAPGGFVGMRGKKSTFNDDLDNVNENANDELNDDGYDNLAFPWQQLPDTDEDLINWNEYARPNARRYKKAPSAFYGVRGKKFTLGNGINPSGDAYRLQQFLQKLDEDNMRHMIVDDFVDSLVKDQANAQQSEMTKRAPIGFTGVRGKRPALTEAGTGDSSMESMGKRGLGNTFVGVRGKKDVSHQTFKRSPLGGGSESSAASGPGGKRQRFLDFGNKFVAVRGKKSSYDDNGLMSANDWANMYQNNNNLRWSSPSTSASSALESNRGVSSAAMRFLYGAPSGKRAPSGFVGMRGKRPISSDDMLTIN